MNLPNRDLSTNPDAGRLAAERRKLLKAAAGAAPLVATLPLGGAWATSTSQCVLEASKTSATGLINGYVDLPPPSSDNWVRVVGQRAGYRKFSLPPNPGLKTVTVYHIAALDKTPGSSDPANWTFWLPDGTEFNQAGWTLSSGPVNVGLLRVFKPVPDATLPTGVAQCTPGTNDSVPTCLFPVSKTGDLVTPSNMGIQVSCLCSVTPSLAPPGLCI